MPKPWVGGQLPTCPLSTRDREDLSSSVQLEHSVSDSAMMRRSKCIAEENGVYGDLSSAGVSVGCSQRSFFVINF